MTNEIAIKEPMQLTHHNVEAVFKDCLTNTTNQDRLVVNGVLIGAAFDKAKIEDHREDIKQMLSQLPTEFHRPGGGGWTFLNACITKSGKHWTDYHRTVDMLVCLGKAINVLHFLLQRDLWKALPGGMPYFYVQLSDNGVTADCVIIEERKR